MYDTYSPCWNDLAVSFVTDIKVSQLRQYLAGEALQVIENLGHPGTEYEAAKDRLGRKFGGKRRQIAMY